MFSIYSPTKWFHQRTDYAHLNEYRSKDTVLCTLQMNEMKELFV